MYVICCRSFKIALPLAGLLGTAWLGLGACAAQESQDRAATAEERYAALMSEYEARTREARAAIGQAKTAEEKLAIAQERLPNPTDYINRFLTLARDAPGAPTALDALTRVITLSNIGRSPEIDAAVEQMRRDWAADPRMERIIYAAGSRAKGSPHAAALLRDVAGKNPDLRARGKAMIVLAELLDRNSNLRRLCAQDPETAARLGHHLGKDQLDRITARDPEAMRRESVELLESLAVEFADVSFYAAGPKDRPTIGRGAMDRLARVRETAIGRTAPEIEGMDLDGRPLRLSDFRGKVVTVVFWATWCGPCMAMVPHERKLVQRLEGKSFALLGVNCDEDKDKALAIRDREKMTWPSWYDGSPGQGKIAATYGTATSGLPRVFVLDGRGVIRYKDVRDKELEEAVEVLLAEQAASE